MREIKDIIVNAIINSNGVCLIKDDNRTIHLSGLEQMIRAVRVIDYHLLSNKLHLN